MIPHGKGDSGIKPAEHAKPKGAEAPGAAPGLQDEVVRLSAEVERAKQEHLRVLAEFDNARKRLQREKEEFSKYAAEGLLRNLLPIIDSLDQALVAVDKQAGSDAVVKGVHLIYRQLLGLLAKESVQRINAVGAPFDPHLHEAVAQVDVDDDTPDGQIVEEVQPGYTMHGKVIRPAMVKVARVKDQKSEGRGQRSEQATDADG